MKTYEIALSDGEIILVRADNVTEAQRIARYGADGRPIVSIIVTTEI